MRPLPVGVHELLVAPAALALAFLHARRALGGVRAAVELGALAFYGFALERVAILVFASHDYGTAWRAAPLGVPLAVAAVWAAVIASAMALSARLGPRSPAALGAGAALIGITLDVLMEPVAVRAGLWEWTPPGPWLGVPVGNFVGWGVIVGSYAAGAELWPGGDGVAAQAGRRAVLGALSVVALILVGLVWTRLGAERLFTGARGFGAWGAILAATAALGAHRRAPLASSGLASRLGATRGAEPASVLFGLAAVFAADALALGGTPLAVAATGSVVVLCWILVRAAA